MAELNEKLGANMMQLEEWIHRVFENKNGSMSISGEDRIMLYTQEIMFMK